MDPQGRGRLPDGNQIFPSIIHGNPLAAGLDKLGVLCLNKNAVCLTACRMSFGPWRCNASGLFIYLISFSIDTFPPSFKTEERKLTHNFPFVNSSTFSTISYAGIVINKVISTPCVFVLFFGACVSI